MTTSSLCDVSVLLDLGDAEEGCYRKELVVGELKHRDSYTIAQCVAQGLLCMQTMLYCLRVTMGLPVGCVYGFGVCGSKCKDVGPSSYVVVLLKVTAPEKLGDPFVYQSKSLVARSLADTSPIGTLIQFLRAGERSMRTLGNSDAIPVGLRAPAYFALPLHYWNNTSQEYKLITGGRVAIVFKATPKGVRLLLGNPKYEDWKPKIDRFRFSEGVKQFFSWGRKPFPYVVKFQVLGVSNGTSSAFLQLGSAKLPADLKETYPISAIASVGRKMQIESYCLVMRNRGEPVDSDTFTSYMDLKAGFQCVWETAMELCQKLPPCDSLVHNVVYDGRFLHLIDVDEGYGIGEPIKKRIMDEEESGEWEAYLQYPDCLRSLYTEYAVVQLTVSFARIAVMNATTKIQAQQDPQFVDLVRDLGRLGNALGQVVNVAPFESVTELPPAIANPLTEVSTTMQAWFKNVGAI